MRVLHLKESVFFPEFNFFYLVLHSLIAATAIVVCRFIAEADLSNGTQ